MGYLRQKETQLSKFYNSGAILVHSNTALKKHYDDVITSIQQLSVLPFHLDMAFIREKALTDSKFKSQEMIGSADGMIMSPTNQKEGLDSTANDSLARARSSVLDFSASKALNWLANAALPKKQTPQTPTEGSDLLTSRSKSEATEANKRNLDLECPANFSSVSSNEASGYSQRRKNQYEHLSGVRKDTYIDAKISTVDCDPIISPSESLRSSISSQTGFTSLFSTMAARLGENPINQSLTQSMTSSASSLVTRLTGIKLGTSPSQKTYKKGVTEYNFEDNAASEKEAENENSVEKDVVDDSDICEVKLREKKADTDEVDRNSKRVSFDIVNLFDKLLLPSSKPEKKEVKPASRIPVPTNRWSWNFGIPKFTSQQSKTIPKASTDSDLKAKGASVKNPSKKTTGKNDSPSHKGEHFPKQGSTKSAESDKSPKGGKPSSSKSGAARVAAPPKPPRLVQSTPATEKKSGTSHNKKNTATL